MLNRKPEFIDPEENKLIYHYNRNSKRKTLEESCCPKRRGFLVFESPKARFALVIVYLVLLGYIYFSSTKYNKENRTVYNDIKIKIVNYYVENEKKVYLNIVFDPKEEKYIHIDSVNIKLNKKSFSLEKDIVLNEKVKINTNYSLSFDLSFKEKPSEISVTLYIKEGDNIVPLKMKNFFN